MPRIMKHEFTAWAERHLKTFGLTPSAKDRETIDLWYPIFTASGYTAAELDYATQTMARNPPKYRSEHLPGIHAAIGGLRKEAAQDDRRDRDTIEAYEVCKDCGDSGWAWVPHPRFVVDGEWVPFQGRTYKPEAALPCMCPRGRRILGSWTGKKRTLSLEQYDSWNPEWRQQIRERDAAQKAEREALASAHASDQTDGPLVPERPKNMAGRLSGPTRLTKEIDEAFRRAAKSQRNEQQLRLYNNQDSDHGL